jgi:hypothetical protein
MHRLLLAFFILVVTGVAASAASLPSWSTWENQRHSIMKVHVVQSNGTFTGVYINNASGFACQGLPGFPLTGRTNGNRVIFKVVWNNGIQNCHSTTVWYGFDQGDLMPTNWILTGPSGTQRGFDLFTRKAF